MKETLEKQRLIEKIEAARTKLNDSIDAKKIMTSSIGTAWNWIN